MSIRNNRFRLNKQNKRFFGVCAGLADYLEAPVFLIRIIAILACVAWPTLILVYLCTYWWLKSNDDCDHPDPMFRYVSGSKTAKHFRNLNYKRPLYRNVRAARIAGVCSGIADYLEVRVRLVRVITILSFIFAGPFIFFAYCACWMALEPQPADYVGYNQQRYRERRARRKQKKHQRRKSSSSDMHDDALYTTQADDPLYQTQGDEYVNDKEAYEEAISEQQIDESIAMSLKECSATFNQIETRLRSVEAYMTSRRFRLHCEINRI